jgi:hypothetical protein
LSTSSESSVLVGEVPVSDIVAHVPYLVRLLRDDGTDEALVGQLLDLVEKLASVMPFALAVASTTARASATAPRVAPTL